MKISHLLAGAAALAMVAGAAQAGTVATGSLNFGSGAAYGAIGTGGHNVTSVGGAIVQGLLSGAQTGPGNNGTAQSTSATSFTLTGNVTPDCVFYTGNGSKTFDLGTIGINADPSAGPSNTFMMAGAQSVAIATDVAGCNTHNSVTVAKAHNNGMQNTSNTGGYDSNVFQNNLDYTVTATWTAYTDGAVGAGTSRSTTVPLGAFNNGLNQGAWRSPMLLSVLVPVASKALVSGTYSDTITVTIAAL